nr:polysaccharide deacetylase [Clostridia bacterium]
MKRNFFTRSLLLLIIVGMVVGVLPANAVGEVCFTAVNDTIRPLSESTLPVMRNGTLYLPYTVFGDPSLGIYYSYNRDYYTLTFYNKTGTLTFDVLNYLAYDSVQQYDYRVIYRNDTMYVPAAFVSSYFGVTYTYMNAAPAPIVRLVTSSTVSTYDFKNNNRDRMNELYGIYIGKTEPVEPTENPNIQPPEPSGRPGSSGSTDPIEPENEVKVAYITFDDGPNKYTSGLLDVLDEYDMKATFFTAGYRMAEYSDVLRRIVGSGHAVGLHTYTHNSEEMYVSVESVLGEFERTNEAVDAVTGIKTRIVRFPWGSAYESITQEMRDAVIDSGYRYWDWNVDALDFESANESELARNVIEGLKKVEGNAVILMHDTEKTVKALPEILRYLRDNDYITRTITQSEMPLNFQNDVRTMLEIEETEGETE